VSSMGQSFGGAPICPAAPKHRPGVWIRETVGMRLCYAPLTTRTDPKPPSMLISTLFAAVVKSGDS